MADNNPWSIEDLLPPSGPFSAPGRPNEAREAIVAPGAVAPPTAPAAKNIQTPLHDLLTQGGVTSSQPMPGAGMGSTQGLRDSSSNIGAGAMSPETMQYMARNDLSSMLSSPSGTPEQRTGWQSELTRMTGEEEAKRKEELLRTQPERQEAARVKAEQALSPTRIAETKAGELEKRETQRQLVEAQLQAKLNEIMKTPFQTGLFAGQTPEQLQTPQGRELIDRYIKQMQAVSGLQSLTGFLQGYGQVSKMFPTGIGATPEQNEANLALILARFQEQMTGIPARKFLQAGPKGNLTLKFENILGQMEPPGLNTSGQIEIGPRKPTSGYSGQPLGSRIQNPGTAPMSGIGDFLTE